MRAFHSLFARCIPAVLTTLAAALLTACGGGSGSDLAGVGSGGSGVASGSVSGFGSVIVDGVEYDDSTATRDTEDATGASVNAAVKLGQRVRLVYAGDKVARRIEVQAQLVGPVSAAPAADGSMTVMGQRVRVVASASDATRSSPTVLDGYAAAADIRAGDEVEVHGAWAYDAALASNVLVATRFEKRPTPPDPVQLGGVVTAIDGATLRLNSASGTVVAATGPSALTGLAVGDVVRVWAARAALAASPVQALRVAGSGVRAADLATNGSMSISGLASHYDPATRSLDVQGVRVKLADGVLVDEAALARGEFVSLQLGRDGSTLLASKVEQRGGSVDLGRTIEVKGVTRGVDWRSGTVAFSLRGTAIEAPAAAIAAGCRAVSMATDVLVEVRGSLAGAVVSASQVSCSERYSGSPTVDYRGTLTAIDPANRRLTLFDAASGASIAASWDERTYFEKLPASLPLGLRVEVEGVMDKGSNTLRLSRVSPSD